MNITLTSDELVRKISGRVDWHFRALSAIPRGSGNERGVADYLVRFAEGLKEKGVTYTRVAHAPISGKEIYDVLIRKPGTGAFANLPVTILQAHADMVCQKAEGSTHDFLKDPIRIQVDGNRMTAKDTTLGADDGIGVACILAILESDEISHPPLEALLTSDEEDGMTGAMAVTRELIEGKRLINIDTESEGVFNCGCAGGINANFTLPIEFSPAPAGLAYYSLEVSGLLGGHSGAEIHEKHANANLLLGRALDEIAVAFEREGACLYLAEIQGGDKKNVITRKAHAVVGVATAHTALLEREVQRLFERFAHECAYVEKDLKLEATPVTQTFSQVVSPATFGKLLSVLVLLPNGVLAMHGGIPDLVETSCNLGMLRQTDSQIQLSSLVRSFIESKKQFAVKQLRTLAGLVGATFSTDSDFPNWEPAVDSELTRRFLKAYSDTFGCDARVESIHAGLECGYFSKVMPELDMIACGPTITGAHTTEETLYLDTVEKITRLLLNVLLQMQDETI